ncbi:hypothetical protein [Streptomyces sp. NPDC002690]
MRFINVAAGTIQVAGADVDLRFMAEELQRLLSKIEEPEPSAVGLPADMVAWPATFPLLRSSRSTCPRRTLVA